MSDLPTGTVTFVFTDIEGSTSMLQRLGEAFVAVLEAHNRLVRDAFSAGTEIRSEGDAFFYVFPSAPDALLAACAAQRDLADFAWPEGGSVMVRMGLHTGEGVEGGDDYVGLDVHRAARIAAAGHGGQILVSDTTRVLSISALSGEVTLADLGEHSFKDLEQPEHVYQVVVRGLPADFPPIGSLDAAPNNLPTQTTTFVGREQEAAEISELLGQNRIVTLTGPGGSGKTRLGLHVASLVQSQHPEGIYYVALESLRSAELVIAAIADTLGLGDLDSSSPASALANAIGGRSILLVVDNFEHVLAAAPEVATLLAQAPDITMLVTSQSPLHIRGEQVYPVPPMATAEAVELFTELATASDPSFQLDADTSVIVDEVVSRLDGMPLALELTAPRVGLFGLAGLRDRLVERLDVAGVGFADLPERHRSLSDAIAWSYDLLEPDQQALLRQLSVFDGGFILEAAEAVVIPSPSAGVTGGVASLLDRSLLRHQVKRGEARFSMLETIRQFALDAEGKPAEHEEAADRHAQYFVELAAAAHPLLDAEDQQVWMDRLADEHDNVRAVLRLSRDTGRPDLGLRTAGSIWRFYHRRGHLTEGREWLELLLGLEGSSADARAVGLDGLAAIAYWQADYVEAKRLYTELLELNRKLGDEAQVADTLLALSTTTAWLGELEEGLELAEEARAAYEAIGAPQGASRVSGAIAWSTWQSGHLDEALRLWTEARANFAALGDDGEVRQTDIAIAAVLHQLGRTDDAVALGRDALEAMVDAGDVSGTIQAMDFIASIAAKTLPRRGVRLAGAADALRAEQGGGLSADSVGLEPVRSVAADVMEAGAIDAARAEGETMTQDDAIELARQMVAVVLSEEAPGG